MSILTLKSIAMQQLTNYHPVDATEVAGYSGQLVQAVRRGMAERLRDLPQPAAVEAVTRAITLFCDVMGIERPTGTALAFAVDTVLKKYAAIGANEVLTAAQMAIAGELGDMPKFYGKFSLPAMGEILTTYLEHRTKVAYQLEKQKDNAEREIREAEQAAEKQAAYEAAFPGLLEQFTGGMMDIPADWHDTAMRLGYLAYTAQAKRHAWELADALARAELERRAEDTGNLFEVKSILRQIEGGDYEGLRIAIAKKLLVWRWFFGRS